MPNSDRIISLKNFVSSRGRAGIKENRTMHGTKSLRVGMDCRSLPNNFRFEPNGPKDLIKDNLRIMSNMVIEMDIDAPRVAQ